MGRIETGKRRKVTFLIPLASTLLMAGRMDAPTQRGDVDQPIHNSGPTPRTFAIRAVWIILTAFSLTALSYHLYTLVFRFQLQPVTIQTSDSEFQFPDIHLCPQFPFSDSRIRSLAEKNDKNWLDIFKNLRRIEQTVFQLNTTIGNRTEIFLKAFWETLDPAFLHNVISLPNYESLIRFKINGVGE